METTVARLRSADVETEGVIGDEDPLRALDDALRSFGGDEIVAATDDDELVAHVARGTRSPSPRGDSARSKETRVRARG